MKHFLSKPYLQVTLYYAAFGMFWIILTDRLLFLLVPNLQRLVLWQTYKGWFFVAASTLLIYALLAAANRKNERAREALAKSEKTYRLLFEDNPLPMWVYDVETLAFLAVNEAAVAAYGYSRAQFLAMSIKDIRPPEDVPRLLADVAQTTRRLNFAGEWRHRRKDGQIFPVEITSHELVYNGRSARLVAATDLSERKKMEDALKESEARFRRLAENAPDLIYRYRLLPEPGFEYVSPVATTITGYTPQDHYDDPQLGYKLVHPDDHHLLTAVSDGNRPMGQPVVLRWIRKDGTIIWTEQRNVPIYNEAGELVAMEGIARDVSEQMRTQQALRESERRFRTAIEEAPFPIIIHAEDGEILAMSNIWTEITGYRLDEIPTISDWTEKAYGVRQKQVQASIDSLYETDRRVEEGEFQITCKDGSHRIWEFSSTPLGALADGRRSLISAAVDVTERRRNEQRLRLQSAALEAAANAIVITDIDGNVEWANSAFVELTGYSVAEVSGKNPREFIKSGKYDKAFYEEMWNTILNGRTWRGELTNRRKDGTLYTEEEVITPVWNDEGNIAHFIAIKQDITRRKEAETERKALLEQVKAQAEQLSQVMRTVPEGVLFLNQSSEILLANPQGQEYLAQLGKVNDSNQITHLGRTPLETLQTSPPTGQWHEVKENGRIFEVITRPVETGPVPQGWVLVLRDVTEQQEVQKQLQQQERLAAIGQLAAGIAHDFNNIMAVIVLYAQMLERSPEMSTRQQKQLATITLQAQQASELIQQILDFSRRSVLTKLSLDFLSLLQGEVNLLRRTLPENIEIALASRPGDYMLQADPTRLRQTIMNLAINARDAMPHGGQLRFELTKTWIENNKHTPLPRMAAGDWITLKVTDSGSGIEPAALEHVFEPFFTTKEPGKGTGLGLAQVYGIIGQHGGHIAIESEVGAGTTFTVYLPALPARDPELANDEADGLPQGHGELLLVVEDKPALREALTESLVMWHYRVLEAASGEEALAQLAERGADIRLVISDVIMPKMGGLALLGALREQGWEMPVILLTGHPLDVTLPELQAQGVYAALDKPIGPAPLAQAVAAALERG